MDFSFIIWGLFLKGNFYFFFAGTSSNGLTRLRVGPPLHMYNLNYIKYY